jgi:hypothetical protein
MTQTHVEDMTVSYLDLRETVNRIARHLGRCPIDSAATYRSMLGLIVSIAFLPTGALFVSAAAEGGIGRGATKNERYSCRDRQAQPLIQS